MQNKIYKLVKAAALTCFVLGAGFLYTYETETPTITEAPTLTSEISAETESSEAKPPETISPAVTGELRETKIQNEENAAESKEIKPSETKNSAEPSPTKIPDARININTAGVAELIKIPGIGEVKASAIISYREEHGPFKRIEDIMKISGIKNGVFQKAKDHIRVE